MARYEIVRGKVAIEGEIRKVGEIVELTDAQVEKFPAKTLKLIGGTPAPEPTHVVETPVEEPTPEIPAPEPKSNQNRNSRK